MATIILEKNITVRPEFILPDCLDGRGGAETFGDEGLLSPSAIAALLKKESVCVRVRSSSKSESITLRPNIRVSRVVSCSGLSRRSALWVAARAEGDGGRGAGFIA
jgi:hypothetical protein